MLECRELWNSDLFNLFVEQCIINLRLNMLRDCRTPDRPEDYDTGGFRNQSALTTTFGAWDDSVTLSFSETEEPCAWSVEETDNTEIKSKWSSCGVKTKAVSESRT